MFARLEAVGHPVPSAVPTLVDGIGDMNELAFRAILHYGLLFVPPETATGGVANGTGTVMKYEILGSFCRGL